MRTYSIYQRTISRALVIIFLLEWLLPLKALALTGGPNQPEMTGFTPIEQTEMVNLFTGDLNYNIPLFQIGNYPVNISYQSGITMDQEASWVGLGWSLNPGAINREVRGLPDDFAGDTLVKHYNRKPNISYGISGGRGIKLVGVPLNLNYNLGVTRNNYRGFGLTTGASLSSITGGQGAKGGMTGSLGLSYSTLDGVSVSASASCKTADDADNNISSSAKIGSSVNSRGGLQQLTLTVATSKAKGNDNPSTTLESRTGSLSFAGPSITPSISMPMVHRSYALNAAFGFETFPIFNNTNFSGFYSEQRLAVSRKVSPAYGYMYAHKGSSNVGSTMDVYREKDVPYIKNAKNIAIPIHQFDLYNISGQGIGGQFRSFRGDAGILFDAYAENTSESFDLGLELGTGNILHTGLTVEGSFSNTRTKKWEDFNLIKGTADFINETNEITYEPSYFRMVGEPTIFDEDYWEKTGKDFIVRINTNKDGVAFPSFRQYNRYVPQSSNLSAQSEIVKSTRHPRVQHVQALNSWQASVAGIDPYIRNYPNWPQYPSAEVNFISTTSYPMMGRDADKRISRLTNPSHHISEIVITKEEGSKYVYGTPVYNKFKTEVSFSTGQTSANAYGQVTYTPGNENSKDNDEGKENYYSAEITPAYAHSYLLTNILSDDYQDMTGDGVTDDDKGSFTKFNYSKTVDNYRWRVPFNTNSSNFNEGLKSIPDDNKANYIYGEKDLWYLHSIESKSQVAIFYLEPRFDGVGVAGENGGVDTDANRSMCKLSKIVLFNKHDLYLNKATAIPVLTVNFEYDYSLCKGIDNARTIYPSPNATGKLTLKTIYFTYRNNSTPVNKYTFDYNNLNPDYHIKQYDRWGFYRGIDNGYPSQMDYPYVIQDQTSQNSWSSAWHLSEVKLPSGGLIKIGYEAKDYAFIQDKRAGQMYLINSVASAPSLSSSSTNLFTGSSLNNYILVDVPISVANKQEVFTRYLEGIDKLYYKFYVDVDDKGSWEYVSGYAEIEDYDRVSNNVIAIKLKASEGKSNRKYNPIARSAWQFLRLYLPEKAYPNPLKPDNTLAAIKSLFSVFGEIVDMVRGYDETAEAKGYGRKISQTKSFIRLNNANFKKLGGGCRVKNIEFTDNWNNMVSNEPGTSYITKYDYTTSRDIDGVKTVISSGVATYEPMLGGDEIPQRQPLNYSDKVLLGPSNTLYSELPFGEGLFPAPTIGYSKVTVRQDYSAAGSSFRNGTGFTVNEFYTAYDFPVRSHYTTPDVGIVNPNPLFKLLKLYSFESQTISQGFLVEVNNMHGKQKAVFNYNGLGALVQSEEYFYKSNQINSSQSILDNNVSVINADGTIAKRTLGLESDLWQDMRDQSTNNIGVTMNFNVEAFVLPIFIPLFIVLPPLIPKLNADYTRFKSVATVKYINKTGILEKVVKTQNGSHISTRNLIFDAVSGKPLITETINEFNDTLLSVDVPAYFAYKQMGGKFQNSGVKLKSAIITNGELTINSTLPDVINEGDLLLPLTAMGRSNFEAINNAIYINNQSKPYGKSVYWVSKTDDDDLIIIDSHGEVVHLPDPDDYEIISSGFVNKMQDVVQTKQLYKNVTTPVTAATHVSTFDNISNFNLLDVSAKTFGSIWKLPVQNEPIINCKVVDPISNVSCFKYLFEAANNYNLQYNTCYLLNPPPDTTLAVLYNNYLPIAPTCATFNGQQFDELVLTNLTPNIVGSEYSFSLGNSCKLFIALDPSNTGVFDLCSAELDVSCDRSAEPNCICLVDQNNQNASACVTCYSCDTVCVKITEGTTINPYLNNARNNWKELQKYVYLDERIDQAGDQRIRNKGYINSNPEGWHFGGSNTLHGIFSPLVLNEKSGWIISNEITRFDNEGMQVEEKDALGIYSSSLCSYQNSLVTAVSKNAQYKEIGNDHFEDYEYDLSTNLYCDNSHFDFKSAVNNNTAAEISDNFAHTGLYSVEVDNTELSLIKTLVPRNDQPSVKQNSATNNNSIINLGGLLEQFSPEDNKEYRFECWTREAENCISGTYVIPFTRITFLDASNNIINMPLEISPDLPSVEGWQRISTSFLIPSNAKKIKIELVAENGVAYFDDVRIYPNAANMKSYVYHPLNLYLMAELDENNYATFYEYDDEGNLIRIKKETQRGIVTVKESRKHIVN